MKKLLFVITEMNIGGPQKALLALLDLLDYRRISVDVLVMRPGGVLENGIHQNAKLVHAHPLVRSATLPAGKSGWSLMTMIKHGKIGLTIDAVLAMVKHIVFRHNMNQMRQHLWLKHNAGLPKLPGEYDAAFGILGLSTYYLLDLVKSRLKYHWIRSDTRILNRNMKIDTAYYSRLDGALSVSAECAKIFEEMYPFIKGRVEVFHNYIPINYYKSLPDGDETVFIRGTDATLVSVSRLDPLKGIELAIQACRILVDKGKDIRWYVLGDGVHRSKVQSLIEDANLERYFILLGFQENVPWYIRRSDIFVHSSRSEGKSNAVDEALFYKVPVVVTDYPTVGDQIQHNYNGLVCAMNGEEIAKAIEKLLEEPELRNRLISSGPLQGYVDPTNFLEGIMGLTTGDNI